MTRVVITGSGGAIGRALWERLASLGTYELIGTQHDRAFCQTSASLYRLDLRDGEQVEQLMRCEPEWVIHCASRWTGLNDDYTVLDDNVRMTLNVARSLPASVTRVVYLSSSAVSRRLPGTYTVAKACEEQVVAARCRGRIGYAIWRPYHVVSPYEPYCPGRSHLVTNLAHAMIDDRAPSVDLRQNGLTGVRLTWVGDVVSAILSELAAGPSDRSYDIGVTECRTIAEVAGWVADWAVAAGLRQARPELLMSAGTPQPPEPYQPDIRCPTSAFTAVTQCLGIRYAHAPACL